MKQSRTKRQIKTAQINQDERIILFIQVPSDVMIIFSCLKGFFMDFSLKNCESDASRTHIVLVYCIYVAPAPTADKTVE